MEYRCEMLRLSGNVFEKTFDLWCFGLGSGCFDLCSWSVGPDSQVSEIAFGYFKVLDLSCQTACLRL